MRAPDATSAERRSRLQIFASGLSMAVSLVAAWAMADRVRAVDLITLFAGGAVFGTTGIALVRSLRERTKRTQEGSSDAEV